MLLVYPSFLALGIVCMTVLRSSSSSAPPARLSTGCEHDSLTGLTLINPVNNSLVPEEFFIEIIGISSPSDVNGTHHLLSTSAISLCISSESPSTGMRVQTFPAILFVHKLVSTHISGHVLHRRSELF